MVQLEWWWDWPEVKKKKGGERIDEICRKGWDDGGVRSIEGVQKELIDSEDDDDNVMDECEQKELLLL